MRRLAILIALLLPGVAAAQVCTSEVVLRQETCPTGTDCSTKGSTLTYAELDGNIGNVAELCLWTTEYDAFTSVDEGAGAVVTAMGQEVLMFKATLPLTVSVSREVASPNEAYAAYAIDASSATDGQVLAAKSSAVAWADPTLSGPKQSFYRFNGYANCGVDSSTNYMGLARANCSTTESLIERAVSSYSTLTVGNIYCYQTQDTSCTVTAMLRKNQADTDFSCTITGGGSCADASGTLSYVDGDDIVFALTDDSSTCDTNLLMECGVYFSWSDYGSGTPGTNLTLDLGDDGGNDSTALAEIAVVNDDRSAFTEPSADKLKIDVQKLRRLSFDNQPASPHAYDCEFDGSICAGWSNTFAGGSGTVDITTAPASEIYDLTTWPGWLLAQHKNASGSYETLYSEGLTIGTDATVHAALRAIGARDVSAASEGEYYVEMYTTADSNETVFCGVTSGGDGTVEGRLCVQNNGTFTCTNITSPSDRNYSAPRYFTLMKDGNVYYCLLWWDDMGPASHIGPQTKTGVTTMDSLRVQTTSDNVAQGLVYGIDFVRFYDSATIALGNP